MILRVFPPLLKSKRWLGEQQGVVNRFELSDQPDLAVGNENGSRFRQDNTGFVIGIFPTKGILRMVVMLFRVCEQISNGKSHPSLIFWLKTSM